MKDSTIIILVVAGVAALFLAINSGLLKVTGGAINVGGGIVAPQPATNYSGYLAASTASGVSGALNSVLSGLSGLAGGWLKSSTPAPVAPAQGANPASPTMAAQPIGVANPAILPTSSVLTGTLVGPQITPISGLSYDNTAGSAFDYGGLAADNSYDLSYSLENYS